MEGRLKSPSTTTVELTFAKVYRQVVRCFMHSKSAAKGPDKGSEQQAIMRDGGEELSISIATIEQYRCH